MLMFIQYETTYAVHLLEALVEFSDEQMLLHATT